MGEGEQIDRIYVARLLELYDPFKAIGLLESYARIARLTDFRCRVTPLTTLSRLPKRRPGWRTHLGRIRYFVEHPDKIDPLTLDNDVHNGNFYGPIVTDGHHRLIAAIRLGWPHIDVSYSGLVSTLEYLRGDTDTKPEF